MQKVVRVHHSGIRNPRAGAALLVAAFVLFIAMFCIGRPVLMRQAGITTISPTALSCDLAMAILLALLATLVYKIHILIAAAFILLACMFHIASMEMAAALNTFIDVTDLHYAAEGQFMKYSLSRLTFPRYTVLLMCSMVLYLGALLGAAKTRPIRLVYVVAGIFISISGLSMLSPKDGEWQSSNLMWLSLTRSIAHPIQSATYMITKSINTDFTVQQVKIVSPKRESYFHKPPGAERNILVVVLEGIPGVYVAPVREWTGVKCPVTMPNLNRIAEKSLVIPNFIVHNRQTIRGLYSLLSGDYCKLSITTPKIYEYVRLNRESRNPCLPEILDRAGYTTVYLQAADLAFMSKNKFMPEAGFERVMGKEYFRYQYVPSGWGPDDRAFFEQAAECIEELNEDSKPWFLTLLTVGTHHPYAIPDALHDELSNRKLASVAYLDESLGGFWKRLRENGTLDDTMVILTSDESHGVQGQPYGNYWGLAVAYSPESFGVINRGVFGLIDIPYSIIDYLGLTGRPHSFPKRSIFREPAADRTVLFGPYVSEEKGIVKKRVDRNCVKIYRSVNGELFSREYDTSMLCGDEGRKLSQELLRFQTEADSSLFQSTRKDRTYVLLEDDAYLIGRGESRLLSSGQYLDIPGGTTVTVELDAIAEFVEGNGGSGGDASVRLVLQMLESYEKMPIPEIIIPALKNGDSIQLSFSFYAGESLTRVWAYLRAISVNPARDTKLTLKRYSVETRECESSHGFRIDRFFITGKGGVRRDLRGSHQPSVTKFTALSAQPHRDAGNGEAHPKSGVEENRPRNLNDPEIVSLRSDGRACVIGFTHGTLDERYDHYVLSIHFTHRHSRVYDRCPSLNSHPTAYTWLHHAKGDKEIMLYFSRTALKQNSVNTVSLPFEGKSMDIEMVGFALRPCLPPIAHAGGGYRGYTYTNSIEALNENADSFDLFEVDIEWTCDNRLVGLHDWGDMFTEFFGFGAEEPVDYDTFRALNTVQGFTPLDIGSIRAFLSQNPASRIVTDVKFDNLNAVRTIAEQIPGFADRFIPQIYRHDEFSKVMEIGYRDIIWTLYRYPHLYESDEIVHYVNQWEEEYHTKPFAVTLPLPAVEKGMAKYLSEAGIPVYAHTVNTCDEYRRLLRLGVSSIYTDSLDITECFTCDPS